MQARVSSNSQCTKQNNKDNRKLTSSHPWRNSLTEPPLLFVAFPSSDKKVLHSRHKAGHVRPEFVSDEQNL